MSDARQGPGRTGRNDHNGEGPTEERITIRETTARGISRRRVIVSVAGLAGALALGRLGLPASVELVDRSEPPDVDVPDDPIAVQGRPPFRTGIRSPFVQFECSGNSLDGYEEVRPDAQADIHGLLSTSEWVGVRMTTLMEAVGVQEEATWALPRSCS